MKTIFFKEFRQHALWALLAMATMGMAMAWSLAQVTAPNHQDGASLLSVSFLIVTTFVGAIYGLQLALVQTLPELKPDRWALLIHRPLSRTAIFLGKVAAGLALYFFATSLPFLAAAYWCFIPGHVAGPVVPGMMWAGGIDLACGAVFYLAGFTFALRKARWKGTKAVPLLAAIAVSLVTHSADVSLGIALAAVVCGGLLLGLTARDAFLDCGLDRGPSRIARGAAALCLFGIALTLLAAFRHLSILQSLGGNSYTSTSYSIGPNGKVYISSTRIVRGNVQASSRTDLAGNPVNVEETSFHYFWSEVVRRRGQYYWSPPGYRDARSQVTPLSFYGESQGETVRWYYVPARRRIEGYGQRTRLLVGTLGPDGFAPGNTPQRLFPDERHRIRNWDEILEFSDGAFLPDLAARTVCQLAGADDMARLNAISLLNRDPENFLETAYTVFSFPDHIRIDDAGGRRVVELPYDAAQSPEKQNQAQLSVIENGDKSIREFLVFYPPYQDYEWTHHRLRFLGGKPGALDRYDTSGRLLGTTTLPPLPEPTDYSSPEWMYWLFLPLALVHPTILSTPWVGAFLMRWWQWGFAGADFSLISGNVLGLSWNVYVIWFIQLALAVGGAWLAWRLLARLPRAGRWTGTAVVFLIGPLAALALWIVRSRERAVPCPACGAGRSPEGESCAACGAPWPEPAREGREIFEREETGV